MPNSEDSLLNMEDSEKNGINHLESGSKPNSEQECRSIRELLRWPQLKKLIIYSSLTFVVVLILLAITALMLYEIIHAFGLPYLYVIGNITGNASADLGTLGIIELKPQFNVDLKITI